MEEWYTDEIQYVHRGVYASCCKKLIWRCCSKSHILYFVVRCLHLVWFDLPWKVTLLIVSARRFCKPSRNDNCVTRRAASACFTHPNTDMVAWRFGFLSRKKTKEKENACGHLVVLSGPMDPADILNKHCGSRVFPSSHGHVICSSITQLTLTKWKQNVGAVFQKPPNQQRKSKILYQISHLGKFPNSMFWTDTVENLLLTPGNKPNDISFYERRFLLKMIFLYNHKYAF